MLQRKFRLPPVIRFTSSVVLQTPYFSFKAKFNNLDYNRFGFVVSKKIDKRAVVRNKIKRVLRECVSDFLQGGTDIILVAKPRIKDQDPEILADSFKQAYEKIGQHKNK